MVTNSTPTQHQPITTMRIGNSSYRVYAVLQDSEGQRITIPQWETETTQKIRGLVEDLITAHECKRIKEKRSYCEIEAIDCTGLKIIQKEGGRRALVERVSHDFALEDVAPGMAQRNIAVLQSAQPLDTATIQAQDLWDCLENLFKNPHPPSLPTQSSASPQTSNPPPALNLHPIPQPPEDPALKEELVQRMLPKLDRQSLLSPKYPRTVLSTEFDLQDHDFSRSDWFEHIENPRIRLRLCENILKCRSTRPVEHFLWYSLKHKSEGSSVTKIIQRQMIPLLKAECDSYGSTLAPEVREAGENLLQLSETQTSPEKITEKMEDFICISRVDQDENFLRYLKEQAIAESVKIDTENEQWAQNHLRDDQGRFVRVLERYLDNS